MQLAIMHYHLQHGGVAQVIRHHLRALELQAPSVRPRVALISSGRGSGWEGGFHAPFDQLDITQLKMAECDYAAADVHSAGLLAERLGTELAAAGFSADKTILHVHNHHLGKNLAVTQLVRLLSQRGYRLLLQLHDFPEDFRPENYARLLAAAQILGCSLGELAYPQSDHIHYAVLNTRDADILLRSGLAAERIHILPNPVTRPASGGDRERLRDEMACHLNIPRDVRLVLYPVRGIRRKNLGEMLLWSALSGDVAEYGVSLAPLNPMEQTSYERWRRLAADLGLACRFSWEAGRTWTLAEKLAAADGVITTSVAEGFGMVFLETWLAGRPLLGRDLPEVTQLVRSAGIQLRGLRDTFDVPSDWIDWPVYCELARERFASVLQAYGRDSSESDFAAEFARLRADSTIDFARLPTQLQQQIITRVIGSSSARRELAATNPQVRAVLDPADQALIEQNAEIVRREFSVARCGQQLMSIYQQLEASQVAPVHSLESESRVLDAFLSFARFHPLRVEP